MIFPLMGRVIAILFDYVHDSNPNQKQTKKQKQKTKQNKQPKI